MIESDEVLRALEELRKKSQARRKKSLKSEKKIKEFIKKVCKDIENTQDFNKKLSDIGVLGGLYD